MTAEANNARGEWVLVPRVPTEAMIDAWRDAPNRWAEAYAAMLAAAPPAPVSVSLDRLTTLDGLVDRIAEAIRDGAGLAEGDPPWERLGEERRAPWRADAMRVLAVVKESLTAETRTPPPADAEVRWSDLRNLILMDAEFAMRGSTSLDLTSIQRLETRAWVIEGHENGEYDITEEGRRAIVAALSQPAGDAEAKTVPVPTRVHLIGETAVIVGTPGRGWDEEGPEAHNCDAMGCSTIGPHVLARVPFTDGRALSQPAEARGMVDGWRLVVRYGEYDSGPGVWAEKDGSLVWIAAIAQQPDAPSETVNVLGMPEFDGLLDHIYEYGTAAEGVIEKANAFARAVIARYAPQQPAAVDEAMLERALIADAREYGAFIPESRARRLLAAALATQPGGAE